MQLSLTLIFLFNVLSSLLSERFAVLVVRRQTLLVPLTVFGCVWRTEQFTRRDAASL